MKNEWKRLDNAAKIFPSAISKSDTQVFRFSCLLKSPVNADILQLAVNETLEVFNVYQCILKRGFFWYYLETCDILPVVHEESKKICNEIYPKNKKGLLFEVTYFKNKINLEFFHVLCDGTGALHFFNLILIKYFSKLYDFEEPKFDYDASIDQMNSDSFNNYYSQDRIINKKKKVRALALKGQRYSENRLLSITGILSVEELKKRAKSYNTSITVFIAACLMSCIADSSPVRTKKRPIILCIPVNLRKRFESETARNFFGLIFTDYNFGKKTPSVEELISKINSDMENGLDINNLYSIINSYTSIEHNFFARIVPLRIKDIALNLAYKHSSKQSTAVLSNVGKIAMPEKFSDYIDSFFINASTNRLQACVCSFNDKLSISFTSPFVNTEIERRFFRLLVKFGIPVEIISNSDKLEK